MIVLLGCEESQAVCIEFRKRGHEAGNKKRQPAWYAGAKKGADLQIRSTERSKTFGGIAAAMAEQWSNL